VSRGRARCRGWISLALGLAACSGSSAPGPAAVPEQPSLAASPVAAASKTPGEPATPAHAAALAADGALEAQEQEAAKPPKQEAAKPPKQPRAQAMADDPWLTAVLRSRPQVARLMDDPAQYRFEVLLTVIDPGPRSKKARQKAAAAGDPYPRVSEHGYRVDAEYIYPASAIKTFASVGALLVLRDLRAAGHRVGLHTPMAYCEGDSTRCHAADESNVADGTITVGHEIRKMQLVSNNVAFNRLYELVGHQQINERMWALGFDSLRVHHRMYGVHDELAQRTTPRIELRPARGKTVVIPARVSELQLPPTPSHDMQLGVGYIDDDLHARIDEPLDFSRKNYVSIRDLHRLTLSLVRPDLPGAVDLGLDRADRAFLLKAMTDDPLESENPVYTGPHFSGLRYHTLIKGMMTAVPLEEIRYVGKAGRAYGFHLDNAYAEHLPSGRALVVTVVGYANANGILNDNAYEYDGITRPLLKNFGVELGRAILKGEAFDTAFE